MCGRLGRNGPLIVLLRARRVHGAGIQPWRRWTTSASRHPRRGGRRSSSTAVHGRRSQLVLSSLCVLHPRVPGDRESQPTRLTNSRTPARFTYGRIHILGEVESRLPGLQSAGRGECGMRCGAQWLEGVIECHAGDLRSSRAPPRESVKPSPMSSRRCTYSRSSSVAISLPSKRSPTAHGHTRWTRRSFAQISEPTKASAKSNPSSRPQSPVDLLVNCAGRGQWGSFVDLPLPRTPRGDHPGQHLGPGPPDPCRTPADVEERGAGR